MDSKNAVNLEIKVQNKSERVRRFFPYESESIDENELRELFGNNVVVGNKRGLDFMKTYNDYMGFHDPYGDKY